MLLWKWNRQCKSDMEKLQRLAVTVNFHLMKLQTFQKFKEKIATQKKMCFWSFKECIFIWIANRPKNRVFFCAQIKGGINGRHFLPGTCPKMAVIAAVDCYFYIYAFGHLAGSYILIMIWIWIHWPHIFERFDSILISWLFSMIHNVWLQL